MLKLKGERCPIATIINSSFGVGYACREYWKEHGFTVKQRFQFYFCHLFISFFKPYVLIYKWGTKHQTWKDGMKIRNVCVHALQRLVLTRQPYTKWKLEGDASLKAGEVIRKD